MKDAYHAFNFNSRWVNCNYKIMNLAPKLGLREIAKKSRRQSNRNNAFTFFVPIRSEHRVCNSHFLLLTQNAKAFLFRVVFERLDALCPREWIHSLDSPIRIIEPKNLPSDNHWFSPIISIHYVIGKRIKGLNMNHRLKWEMCDVLKPFKSRGEKVQYPTRGRSEWITTNIGEEKADN